jgi:hypothetical protein
LLRLRGLLFIMDAERCRSGRTGRSRKPLILRDPRVRIPASPMNWSVYVTRYVHSSHRGCPRVEAISDSYSIMSRSEPGHYRSITFAEFQVAFLASHPASFMPRAPLAIRAIDPTASSNNPNISIPHSERVGTSSTGRCSIWTSTGVFSPSRIVMSSIVT